MKNRIGDMLAAQGFNEIMNNSLTRSSYYDKLETFKSDHLVQILNPLSNDLNVMRQSLLFGVLETVVYNQNRRNKDLKLFEYGNCYFYSKEAENDNSDSLAPYSEQQHLALALTGEMQDESWHSQTHTSDFYHLKAYVKNVLQSVGINAGELIAGEIDGDDLLDFGMAYLTKKGDTLVYFGQVSKALQKTFEIDSKVYYADFDWDVLLNLIKDNKTAFSEISKFQEVRRDLALLIDNSIRFEEIEKAAFKTESKLLKEVSLFDVYEGKNLPAGKKSYAVKFILKDDNQTLTDKNIDRIMNKLIKSFEHQLGAQLR